MAWCFQVVGHYLNHYFVSCIIFVCRLICFVIILLFTQVGALKSLDDDMFNPYDGKLTFLGRVLAQLPVDIRVGKLVLLGHVFGMLEDCIIIGKTTLFWIDWRFSIQWCKSPSLYTYPSGWPCNHFINLLDDIFQSSNFKLYFDFYCTWSAYFVGCYCLLSNVSWLHTIYFT